LVIFILNYIPIVGGLAAIVLPVAFGLVQFETLTMDDGDKKSAKATPSM